MDLFENGKLTFCHYISLWKGTVFIFDMIYTKVRCGITIL